MKKLLFLVLLGVAAWQASKHYPDLMHPAPSHEVLVQNRTGRNIERLRVQVGGQTFVKEVLQSAEVARFPFRVARDATFELTWKWSDRPGESTWRGGLVPQGPSVQRYTITLDRGGGVFYRVDPKTDLP